MFLASTSTALVFELKSDTTYEFRPVNYQRPPINLCSTNLKRNHWKLLVLSYKIGVLQKELHVAYSRMGDKKLSIVAKKNNVYNETLRKFYCKNKNVKKLKTFRYLYLFLIVVGLSDVLARGKYRMPSRKKRALLFGKKKCSTRFGYLRLFLLSCVLYLQRY